MIRNRAPLPKANAEELFINKGNPNDLSGLDLDQLAQRYVEIDAQSQLLKGLILLEARNRFESDREFGAWIQSTQALCLGGGQPARTRYINLARFFKDRDMTGISITAAYEISRPDNADIAEEIYIYALNKNLQVAEIKQKIELVKTSLISEDNKNEHDVAKKTVKDKQKSHIKMIGKIVNLLNSFELEPKEKIILLEESIQNIKKELSETNIVSENVENID
jgi:hypothetical protein